MLSIIISGLIVALCVLLHYEALNLLSILMEKLENRRVAILLAMFGLLAAHMAEIWIFAIGYYVFGERYAMGEISGVSELMDYVYYSSVVYTTLGFGDLLPTGQLRMLTGAESLAGLALITWSATFTLALAQRKWNK